MWHKSYLFILTFTSSLWFTNAYDFDCYDFPTTLETCYQTGIAELFQDNQDTFFLHHTEVTRRCIYMRRYIIACLDNYKKHCFVDEKKLIDKRIFGTDTFIEEFCNADSWQTLRSRHEECFARIQQESQKCGLEFMSRFNAIKSLTQILGTYNFESEVNVEILNLICCDKFVPSNCTYDIASRLCLEGTAEQIKAALGKDPDEIHYVTQMTDLCHRVSHQLKCHNSAYSTYSATAISTFILILVSYVISVNT